MSCITGVVGLDLSLSSTGFARFDLGDSSLETWTLKTKITDGSTVFRAKTIAMKILALMQPGDMPFIEDYAFSIKPQASSIVTLGELGGIVKLLLLQFTGREALTFTTSEMRKFISGDGKLKKEMIPVWTYKRYDREMHSHDECVAAVLADMGLNLMGVKPLPFPIAGKKQQDVIDRLQKKYMAELQSLARS